jgi:exosome complex RNA-binding protein Csl4
MSEKKIVLPGSYLCNVEEFVAGKNTYSEDDGVFSATCGTPVYEGKVVNVIGKKSTSLTIDVIGGILDIIEICAFVVPVSTVPENADIFLPETLPLPIWRLGMGYVKNIRDVIRVGDIIKGRLVKGERGYELGFFERSHGVLKGFCSSCRSGMFLKNNLLMCPSCKLIERRRISSEYWSR